MSLSQKRGRRLSLAIMPLLPNSLFANYKVSAGVSGHSICYPLKRQRIYLKFGSIDAFTLHSFWYKFWVFSISKPKDTTNYVFTQSKKRSRKFVT